MERRIDLLHSQRTEHAGTPAQPSDIDRLNLFKEDGRAVSEAGLVWTDLNMHRVSTRKNTRRQCRDYRGVR